MLASQGLVWMFLWTKFLKAVKFEGLGLTNTWMDKWIDIFCFVFVRSPCFDLTSFKKIDIAFKNVKVILFYIINNFYITGVKCNSLIPSFKFKFQFNFLVCPTPFKFKLMQKI